MYQIMYKEQGCKDARCMGGSTDLEQALEEMDRLEATPLAQEGTFYIFREGTKKDKLCIECKAVCSGVGKPGNGNQCSFYTTEEEEVFKW